MFLPSMVRSVGRGTPASLLKRGRMSTLEKVVFVVVPAGIFPGHLAMKGTRWPPSRVVYLLPESGPDEPLLGTCPLSAVKMTRVFCSWPFSLRACSRMRQLSSSSATKSAYFPLPVVPLNLALGAMGVWAIWCAM